MSFPERENAAAAQGLAFGRNAILGRMLSPTDFGVAAALTVMLHGIETISDLAVDRMILQADDSGDRRLLAAGHALSLLRDGKFIVPTIPIRYVPGNTDLKPLAVNDRSRQGDDDVGILMASIGAAVIGVLGSAWTAAVLSRGPPAVSPRHNTGPDTEARETRPRFHPDTRAPAP